LVAYVAAGVLLITASRCRADVSESICRPHAVVECATGKLLSVRVTGAISRQGSHHAMGAEVAVDLPQPSHSCEGIEIVFDTGSFQAGDR
jgi:hypothetical protein